MAALRRMTTAARSMRAVVVDKWLSNPQALTVGRAPEPEIDIGCVKVAVAAAGANFFDQLMVAGKYQIKPSFPFIPGSEFAGIVTEIGDDVDEVAVGDRVFGGGALGCYADTVVVPSDAVRKVPRGMTLKEAAGIFITFPTSWAALVLRAKLQPGETCLVHAGAGGVGIVAVQIAKAMGATVIATAGSAEKLEVVKKHGADYAINYREEDWIDRVKEITEGEGADVIYDPVGLTLESTKCIAWNGRYLVVGFAAGDIPKVAMNRVLLKNISLVGLHWGAYVANEPERIPEAWDAIRELVESGKVKSVVYPTEYTLDTLGDALSDIMARKTYGKVVVSVNDALEGRSKL